MYNLSNVHCIWTNNFDSLMVLDSVAVFWIAALCGAIYSVYKLLRSYSNNNNHTINKSNH